MLLVLAPEDDDTLEIAGALLPQGEVAADLLRAITPWLQAARRSRAVQLHHGPEGVPAVEQRSCLVAPLVAQGRLLGHLYADLDGAFGRFGTTDRDLLAMLAAQAAVALDNAQWALGLERQVERRTRELREALERQTATAEVLQVISNSMTDAQPVFDAVLDGCERLFEANYLGVFLARDEQLHVAAYRGVDAQTVARHYPRPLAGTLSEQVTFLDWWGNLIIQEEDCPHVVCTHPEIPLPCLRFV